MTNTNTDHASHYRPALAHWPKSAGERPSEASFATLHGLGLRPGAKHALAMAMYMRDDGATDAQVRQAAVKLGNSPVQGSLFNYMRDYVAAGLFKREPMAPRDGKAVYRIVITARGEATLAKRAVKAGDATPAPEKAKAAKKATKRKAKVVTVAASAEKAKAALALMLGDTPAPDAPVNLPALTAAITDQPQG